MLDNTENPSGPYHWVDSSNMPKWGLADDGRNVKLTADPELQVEYAAWLSRACRHTSQFTGKTLNAGGVEVYKRYCKTCGIATTQSLPHRSIANTTVTLIGISKREALVDRYIGERRDELDAMAMRAANRLQPTARADYADYLAGPEWNEVRSLVMERCGGLCEGCRKQSASDVHHLTYRNIRAEFLFELVGLCRDCHDRWHERQG